VANFTVICLPKEKGGPAADNGGGAKKAEK
jgi:hypothetical protein